MGSGKSTVGRVLAMRLKWPFKDSDALIQDLEGMPIARLFAEKGGTLLPRPGAEGHPFSTPEDGERVLAVGGGGFNDATIPYLKRLGPTVHLDLSFEEGEATHRPGSSKAARQRSRPLRPVHPEEALVWPRDPPHLDRRLECGRSG